MRDTRDPKSPRGREPARAVHPRSGATSVFGPSHRRGSSARGRKFAFRFSFPNSAAESLYTPRYVERRLPCQAQVARGKTNTTASYPFPLPSSPVGLQMLARTAPEEPNNDSDSEMADDIFTTVDRKVKQLEVAIHELQQVLEVTALQAYFDSVLVRLHSLSNETNRRLDEVSAFYAWLRQHNTSTTSTSAGYFSILPEELSLYILSFLTVQELTDVSRVSRYWRRLSEDDQLWQSLHRLRWHNGHGLIRLNGLSYDMEHKEGNNSTDEDMQDFDEGRIKGQRQKHEGRTARNGMHKNNRKTKRKRRGWKEMFIDGHRLESNWIGGRFSTRVVRKGVDKLSESVYCIKFNNDKVVTGSNDRTVRVSDLKTGDCVHVLEGHTAEVRAVDFDDTKLVSGSRDRSVKVWDSNTGQCLLTMEEHVGPVKCIQMTDNIVLSGSEDASMKMFDLNSGKAAQTFQGHVWGVACLQFRGDYIVSGSRDRRVVLWDRRMAASSGMSRPFLRVLEGHTNTVRCVAFDSKTIVSGSWDNYIKVWDMTTGETKKSLLGHESRVLCLAFDEKKIVSGSVDKSIKVWWDYENTAPCYSLNMHDAPIFYLRFDDYGIVSGSRDTEIISWDFYSPNEDDIKRAKRCAS